ncbi:MAG: pyridoxal phosphate-dependent aminotransferase [Candidatus Heimdallarchaeota archaeon]|nr:pyridoxal phosphate-dependent aminotransferase [Candidatus Heimdallarchaeota archaeon]
MLLDLESLQKKPIDHLMDSIVLGKIVKIRDQILKAEKEGKPVFRFESGDPNFSVSPNVLETITRVAEEGKTHYPPSTGVIELREAIMAKLEQKNKIIVPSIGSIFVTHGAMNALFSTIFCLLQPGDEVIIPDPMWPEIGENIKIARGVPIPVKLSHAEDYEYSAKRIEDQITKKTKAIYLNTPHNPTGRVLSKETLIEIIEVAKKYKLWIISDEAYEHILFKPYKHYSIASLAKDYADKVVSIFSFSKSHAMSGLRLGYIVNTSKILQERLPKILRCVVNGANSVTQWAGITAIQKDHDYTEMMRREYEIRSDIIYTALSDVPDIKLFRPQGSFFIWVELEPPILERMGCKDTGEVSDLLAKLGVGSIPGDTFGKSNTYGIRFAFSCGTEMVRQGSIILREALLGIKSQ